MANINDVYAGGGRYLKVGDLQGREPVVTIERVEAQLLRGRGGAERKLIVYFVGKEKGLKLNVTMARAIATIVGSPETQDWSGAKVQLYTAMADYGGESFDVVRVRAPQTTRAIVTPPKPAPRPQPIAARPNGRGDVLTTEGLTADDIPF